MAGRGSPELRIDPEDRLRSSSAPPRKPPKPPEKSRKRPRKPGGWGRFFGWGLVKWGLLAVAWVAILCVGAIAWFSLTLPPTGDLMTASRRPSVTLLASDGSLIATFGDLFGEPLPVKALPPYLPEALIATEDRRFYQHFGVDPVGLARAIYVNLRAGHAVQGGSTLTQQLAKNLFLTPERTMSRKFQEVLLAFWLEHKFTKEQLLEIYLNRVYFGAGTYGIDAAARRYFDKSARDVTLYEAAVLAGLLKAPTRFSPARDKERAAGRASQVLANMVAAGFLTDAQAQNAMRQSSQLGQVQMARPASRYFADWVAEQASGYGGTANRDIVVTTTFDPKVQAAAEAAVADMLAKEGPKAAVSQAAMVAMSPDGAIRAMVGGKDYSASQFNRVTQALRQPGSSFKPFVYLAALENGMSPYERFVDGPIDFGGWKPRNYGNKYYGDVSVSDAVAESMNTVAVQVMRRTGVDKVIATAHRLGITSELGRDMSLALGTSEVTLLELTSAYCAFASGGVGAWPYGIAEIKDNRGQVLYRREGSGPGQVIDPGIAAQMTQLLSGVIQRGTGKSASLDRPAAGKTGTTQDSRDALFVGYTADLVAGVWLGNDDNSPMTRVTGGGLPAKTWHNFMMAAEKGRPIQPLIQRAPNPAIAMAAPQPSQTESSDWLGGLISRLTGGGSSRPVQREPSRPREMYQYEDSKQ